MVITSPLAVIRSCEGRKTTRACHFMPRRGIGTTWLAAVGTWMSAIHFGLRPLRHSLGTSDGVPAECSQYGRSWWTTASPYRGLPAYLGPLCATGNCRCCRPRIDGG